MRESNEPTPAEGNGPSNSVTNLTHPKWCVAPRCGYGYHMSERYRIDQSGGRFVLVDLYQGYGERDEPFIQLYHDETNDDVCRTFDIVEAAMLADLIQVLIRSARQSTARRAGHAFTVERTNGDHFIWKCRCGEVIVQDPLDGDIQQRLMNHTGGGR